MEHDVKPALPARAVTWVLGFLLSTADVDAVIGDLTEEHTLRFGAESPLHHSWWYWSQIARSLPPLVWAAVQQGRWGGLLGAAFAAWLLASAIEAAGIAAVSKLVDPGPAHTAIMLLVGLASMAVGGYAASSMRRGAAMLLAALVALMVVALVATTSNTEPVWYQLGFLVLGPMSVLAGGALSRWRQA